ncbi:AAA family ATPase [Kineococcus aurantiacus]|uniref:Gluconate kinase n=1 Tax=Kineococcus aurantiacus TaxID=37633 RepID=A0A7Y9J156_9ACTN|nr:AAA family ATPase [Kineococcus aurantiacus]NYD22820.1 gluconate kinase [Kineococcus aurantiacus]
MGVRNVLVEGVSGTGKTSVATELQRRGFHVVHGDRELAHQADPVTGEPTGGPARHEHHVWPVDAVRRIAADRSRPVTFFCGGSRNWARFLDVFDVVVVLTVDAATLQRRLAARAGTDEWGATAEQRERSRRLHATQEDVPAVGVRVDATRPLAEVVDEVLALAAAGA